MQDASAAAVPIRSRRQVWLRRLLPLLLLASAIALIARMHTFAAPRQVDVASLYFERLDGTALPSSSLQGKAVVLNFWAPWCPPCRVEMPWLEDLQKTNPNLVVLGMEDDPDEYANGMDLAAHKGITYPLVRSSQALHQQLGTIDTLPTTLFISPSGRVVHAVTGTLPEPLMRKFAHDAESAR